MNNESHINEIMDWFDFDKVAQMMMAVDFGWVKQEKYHTKQEVVARLREIARKLIRDAADDAEKNGEAYTHQTGGLSATVEPSGEICLQAVVESFDTYRD